MMVNLDVVGYTRTLNHRKRLRKTQKSNKLLETKRILKPKYKLCGCWVFTFSFSVGDSPFCNLDSQATPLTILVFIWN